MMYKKTTFTLFVICLLLPSQVFATQFIPYDMGITQPKNPKICILDNSAQADAFNFTQSVLTNISTKLNYITRSHDWDMNLSIIDIMHMTDCNITFVYTLQRSDPISFKEPITHKPIQGHILGYTSCDPETFAHTYCEIDIFLLNNNKQYLFTTVEHEFLHALGLGHRQGDTERDMMRAFLSDDLMYPSAKTFQHLTTVDILAIIHLYGFHGFHVIDSSKMPQSYVIPYSTSVKEYCNGINGTICIAHF